MLNPVRRWLAPLHRRLIYHPVPPNHLLYARLQSHALDLKVCGNKLQGWHRVNPNQPESALLYFGGNAEDVAHSLDFLARLPVSHVLAFNYRGYGLSEGVPSEFALYEDAEEIRHQVIRLLGLTPQQLHLSGRSLGSAVATHVAANSPVASVSLLTPLLSIEAIARTMFPHLPECLLPVDRFDLEVNAKHIDTPMLAVLAGKDEVIPHAHSLKLCSEWKGPKQHVLIPEATHNNITSFPECGATLAAFLGKWQSA